MAQTLTSHTPAWNTTVNGSNGINFVFTCGSAIGGAYLRRGADTYVQYNWIDGKANSGSLSNGNKTWTVTFPRSGLVSGSNEFTLILADSSLSYSDAYTDTFYLTVQFASLTAPTSLTISQDSYSRQLKASWNAATASGGSGSVTYELVDIGDGTKVWPTSGTSTSRSCTFTPLVVGTSREYGIQANYSGLSAMGKRASFTHKKP